MTHKYKLGDYVKYYASIHKINGRIEYADVREGFVNRIEEGLNDNGEFILRYCIGLYIGATGYIIREEMIICKLKAPKNKTKLEWMRMRVKCNDANINQLNEENKSLRKEISKLERELIEDCAKQNVKEKRK